MLGFNGGLLGKQRVSSIEMAPGLWTPNEQSVAKRAGAWPLSPGDAGRYYRFSNFADTSLANNTLDLTEIELYDSDLKHTGITCSANFSWTLGSSSILVDGIADSSNRAYKDSWSTILPTAQITFDLGSTQAISHVKIFSLYQQPRFPASFDLLKSNDNVTYTPFGRVTVGTSFTSLGGNVFASEKVSIFSA